MRTYFMYEFVKYCAIRKQCYYNYRRVYFDKYPSEERMILPLHYKIQ